MRSIKGSARLLLPALAAAALLAGGCSAPEQETPEATVPIVGARNLKNVPATAAVDVTLRDGKCVVSFKEDPFHVAPGQLVQWWVANMCDDRVVKLIEVRFGGDDPLIHGRLAIQNLQFGNSQPIVARAKDKGQLTNGRNYPYQFFIDGVAQGDPDIIIEFDTMIIIPPLRPGAIKKK